MTIVNDDHYEWRWSINVTTWSVADDSRGVIYDSNMFIMQAIGYSIW
jgi:hypothetical protein